MNRISNREYIVADGVVVVRFENNTPLFLLLRSYSFWEPPKGRKDNNEEDFETAVRETKEETGIDQSSLSFKWGKDYYETEPYRKKKDKIVRYFVAETDRKEIEIPFNPEMGKKEHEEYRWVNRDEAKLLVNERIFKVIDWAYNKIMP